MPSSSMVKEIKATLEILSPNGSFVKTVPFQKL